MTSTLLWLRRDLRLSDHPALTAAVARGLPVVPVFVYDEAVEALGAASRQRLELSLAALTRSLADLGCRLILRKGAAQEVLGQLVQETSASAVYWSRSYDPTYIPRDTAIKAMLESRSIVARSFKGALLFEPWDVETGQGGPYRVYTPFWRAVRGRDVATTLAAPSRIPALPMDLRSDRLQDWGLSAAMRRGAAVLARYITAGEAAATDRLNRFLGDRIDLYRNNRDFPALGATSDLSDHLTWGEISPAAMWHGGQSALDRGAAGAEHFLKEVVWREFAWHLAYHSPRLLTRSWREEWSGFPWDTDDNSAEVTAWKQARTGVPMVDAGLREMYVTGRMHNRVRMIVASYLTKHLLADWRIGQRWFADTLTDWDPASNAMGWQWVAGSGPDAAPYFRVFNPVTQAEKFDGDTHYVRRWLAEGQDHPGPDALAYFDAVPCSWGLTPENTYPAPVVALDRGRDRALAAYERFRS